MEKGSGEEGGGVLVWRRWKGCDWVAAHSTWGWGGRGGVLVWRRGKGCDRVAAHSTWGRGGLGGVLVEGEMGKGGREEGMGLRLGRSTLDMGGRGVIGVGGGIEGGGSGLLRWGRW